MPYIPPSLSTETLIDPLEITTPSGYALLQHRVDLVQGQEIAGSKQDVQNTWRQYAVFHHFNFIVAKSNKKNYWVECDAPQCPARAHFNFNKRKKSWHLTVISTYNTCSLHQHTKHSPCANRKYLSQVILPTVSKNSHTDAQQVLAQLVISGHSHVSHSTVSKALEHAKAADRGSDAQSYGLLKSLSESIVINGGVSSLLHEDSSQGPVFRSFFAAPGGCRQAYSHTKRLVALDGTFLKGRFGGTLYIAVTIDAQGELLPLAWAVSGEESIDNWSWFMRMLLQVRSRYCGARMIFVLTLQDQ